MRFEWNITGDAQDNGAHIILDSNGLFRHSIGPMVESAISDFLDDEKKRVNITIEVNIKEVKKS